MTCRQIVYATAVVMMIASSSFAEDIPLQPDEEATLILLPYPGPNYPGAEMPPAGDYGYNSAAQAINENGSVTGVFYGTNTDGGETSAVLWKNDSFVQLCAPPACRGNNFVYDLNNLDQIVGHFYQPGSSQPIDGFVWDNGLITKLEHWGETDESGRAVAIPTDINDSGQIVGYAGNKKPAMWGLRGFGTQIGHWGTFKPVLETAEREIFEREACFDWDGNYTGPAAIESSDNRFGYISRINNHGLMIGQYQETYRARCTGERDGEPDASLPGTLSGSFLYSNPGGRFFSLTGDLDDPQSILAAAAFMDLNNLGDSVFYSVSLTDPNQFATAIVPYAADSSGQVRQLEGFNRGKENGIAAGINDNRIVVGYTYNNDELRDINKYTAVLWSEAGVRDLNYALPFWTPWKLITANDINNCGEIVGTAYNPVTGQQRAYKLKPHHCYQNWLDIKRFKIVGAVCPQGTQVAGAASPTYTLWNGFLSIINILELINTGVTTMETKVELFAIDGRLAETVNITVPAGSQQDVILNDLSGFRRDSYGIVKVTFAGGQLDGRLFYYRLTDGHSPFTKFDFAFGVPFSAPKQGTTFVGFNTFHPSADSEESANLVYNWLSVVNLADQPKRFTVEKYNQAGTLLSRLAYEVPAFARVDVESGHVNPGPLSVGLNKIVPEDPASQYLAQLMRYGDTRRPGAAEPKFGFAFPLSAQRPLTGNIALPAANIEGADNWIEIINTADEEVSGTLIIRDESDVPASRLHFFTLAPRAQVHIQAAADLEAGEVTYAEVESERPGDIIAQSMFYYRTPEGKMQAMYGTQGRRPRGQQLSGSYNLFLNMDNYLRASNTSNVEQDICLEIKGVNKPHWYRLGAGRTLNLNLFNDIFETRRDTYGQFSIYSPAADSMLAEVLRIRPDSPDPGVDFAAPAEVR